MITLITSWAVVLTMVIAVGLVWAELSSRRELVAARRTAEETQRRASAVERELERVWPVALGEAVLCLGEDKTSWRPVRDHGQSSWILNHSHTPVLTMRQMALLVVGAGEKVSFSATGKPSPSVRLHLVSAAHDLNALR